MNTEGQIPESLSTCSQISTNRPLTGKMSGWELLCSVLAFAAPVTSVSSLIPFVIQGGGLGAPLVILGAMLLMLVFSIGFLAMSERVTKPGAFYAYVMQGCGINTGQGAAFIAVFAYFTLGLCTTTLMGTTISSFLNDVFGIAGFPWYLCSILVIGASGVLSYLRIDLSAKVLTLAMFVEILIVVAFNLTVPVSQGLSKVSFEPLSPSHALDGNFTIAFLYSIIIFIGFESTAVYRDEVANPRKTIPKVTYIAVIFIGVFYAISAWMTITAFGNEGAIAAANADAAHMFMNAMYNYLGKTGVDLTKGILIISAFACLVSTHNVLSRYVYALSRNNAIPATLGKVHAKHGSPFVGSMTCTAGWILVTLLFIKSNPTLLYAQFGGVGTYAMLILMSLTTFAVLTYFLKERMISLRTFWCPLVALVGLLSFVGLTTVNFHYLTGGEPGDGRLLQLTIFGMFAYGYLMAFRTKHKISIAQITP